MTQSSFLGTGIYSIGEASRLTQVPPRRIRRWLLGYRYSHGGAVRVSPAVLAPELPLLDGIPALGFLDLQEVRLVDAFLSRGVSWRTLRTTEERGRAELKLSHLCRVAGSGPMGGIFSSRSRRTPTTRRC